MVKKDDLIVKLVREHIRNERNDVDFDGEPEEPRPQDCCGQSCKPCVFDIHNEDLVRWAKSCAKVIEREENKTLYDEVYDEECEGVENGEKSSFELKSYTPFTISSITKLTSSTSLFRFETQVVPDSNINQNCSNLPLGCHLRARIPNLNESTTSRQYTPTKCGKNWFEAPIKIYEGGKFTSEIAKLNIGDRVDFRGPYGVDEAKRILEIPKMIYACAGTGIAPFVRILEKKILQDNDDHLFRIIYCISDFDHLLFGQQLGEWARGWNVEVTVFVSRPGSEKTKLERWPHLLKIGNEEDRRMEKEDFLKVLEGVRKFSATGDDIGVAVCGHNTFEKDVLNWALEAGIKPENFIRFPP